MADTFYSPLGIPEIDGVVDAPPDGFVRLYARTPGGVYVTKSNGEEVLLESSDIGASLQDQIDALQLEIDQLKVEKMDPFSLDASLRLRTGSLTSLFDGKVSAGADDPLLWNSDGTGAATPSGSGIDLSVTSGQYIIRQSKGTFPYFSGKSQLIEMTFDKFAPQANIVKRAGYFSSSITAPYTSNFDGAYIESSGGSIQLVVVNNGVNKLSIDWTLWDGYSEISTYNWDQFTVAAMDFLWLGGAVLRLFIKNPSGGFTLAHTFNYAGTSQGVFMRTPNQPVRYEVRSTGGTGSIGSICSQVSSEGALSLQSKRVVLYHSSLINTNTISTIYAAKGVRKKTTGLSLPVQISAFGGALGATADAGVLMLCQNPTLSAPLTWTDASGVQEATGTGQTLTNTGRVIAVAHINSSGESQPFGDNALAWLGATISGVRDEIVLAYMPLTNNQAFNGAITIGEY